MPAGYPPCSCPQGSLAEGTSPVTEGAGLSLASLGVSSFPTGPPILGFLPLPQGSGRRPDPGTNFIGWRGLRGHQAPGCPWRYPPWRQGNKRLGAQRELSGPTTTGWGEGAERGHTSPLPQLY